MKRDFLTIVSLAWVISACTVSGDYGNTRFRCDQGETCPSGYECMAGFCELPGQSADAAPGTEVDARPASDASDGTTPLATCGSLGRLFENFTGGTIDTETWDVWQEGPIGMQHSGGQLLFNYPAGMANIGGGYFSRNKRHLVRGSRVSVEVVEVNGNVPVELNFEIKDLDDNIARISHYLGSLQFIYRVGVDQLEIGSVPFDPDMHRFWQVREENGTFFWETSADGMTWTTHEQRSSAVFAEFAEMQVSIWLREPLANPGRIVVDNLNGGTPKEEPWCPAGSISDNFDATERAVIWGGWDDPSCTRVLADGRLTVGIGKNSMGQGCGFISRAYFDVNASAISVEVPQVSSSGPQTYFSLWLTNGDKVETFHGEGRLYFTRTVAGVRSDVGSLAYDATAHRWWRIRGDSGIAHWETSPDGRTWTTQVSHNNPLLRLDEVEIVLWFYANSATGQSRSTAFDNFNLAL